MIDGGGPSVRDRNRTRALHDVPQYSIEYQLESSDARIVFIEVL